MLSLTNVMDLFADEFAGLGAGCLPLPLIAPGTAQRLLLRHMRLLQRRKETQPECQRQAQWRISLTLAASVAGENGFCITTSPSTMPAGFM